MIWKYRTQKVGLKEVEEIAEHLLKQQKSSDKSRDRK